MLSYMVIHECEAVAESDVGQGGGLFLLLLVLDWWTVMAELSFMLQYICREELPVASADVL